MKKLAIAASILLSTSAFAGSYQFGTVTELIADTEQVSFQIDTSNGADIRADNCNGQPLNFVIDFNLPTAQAMFELVHDARKNGTSVGVNGDGVCWAGGEFERVSSIAPAR